MIKYGRQEIRAKLENKNYEGKLGKGAKFNYMFFLGQINKTAEDLKIISLKYFFCILLVKSS